MKRIFIFYCVLISHYSYSQITQPFPDSSASWVITEWSSGGGAPGGFQIYTYRYFCNGDTSINGVSYKKLKESFNLDPSDTISSTVVGYYRIDGQKVFYLQDSSYAYSVISMYNYFYFHTNQEILLYDFGIQIGDTFTQGEVLKFIGVPYFAPELFRAVRPKDPLKAKQMLDQFTQATVNEAFLVSDELANQIITDKSDEINKTYKFHGD